jgi:hypothetical protein
MQRNSIAAFITIKMLRKYIRGGGVSLKKRGGDWSKAGYMTACLCAYYHCTAHTQPCVVNSAVVNSVSQLPLLAVRCTAAFTVYSDVV